MPVARAQTHPELSPRVVRGAALWRGFSLEWSYNHRMHRIGSCILPDRDQLVVRGAAASGTGRDVATVETHLSLLHGRSLRTAVGGTALHLYGLEHQLLVATGEVELPVALTPAWRAGVALLGGFDLVSVRGGPDRIVDADKVQRLYLSVGRPVVRNGRLRVPVRAAARMRCRTLECRCLDRHASYVAWVGITLVPRSELADARPFDVVNAYHWTRLSQPRATPRPLRLDLGGDAHAVGLRSIHLRLDRELHLLRLSAVLGHPTRDEARHRVDTRLWFINARPGMWRRQLFSFPNAGAASVSATGVLLGFRDVETRADEVQHRIAWPGQNRPADSATAIRTTPLSWLSNSTRPSH